MQDIRHYTPGELIGPYLVKGWLGGGGSSHVYVASSETDRDFAVKVCKQNLRELPPEARHENVQRLSREFNVLQTLSHENIVRVFGFGWTDENEDGLSSTPYVVMEVIQGIPLDKVLKEQQLALMVLMEIFRKVAGAVAYLHKKEIVHRDIKPSNVVVRENGSPVLIDFGIVRAPWFETLTKPSQILGTYDFMSPECINCCLADGVYRPKATDDVYALGVMLYRMLTGAMPARGNPMQRLHGHHMPPEHPCRVAPRVPRQLGDLTMRLLDPNLATRLQDGQAVVDALTPLLVELQPLLFAPAPERVTESLSTIGGPASVEEPPPSAAPDFPGQASQDEAASRTEQGDHEGEAERSVSRRRSSTWLLLVPWLLLILGAFYSSQPPSPRFSMVDGREDAPASQPCGELQSTPPVNEAAPIEQGMPDNFSVQPSTSKADRSQGSRVLKRVAVAALTAQVACAPAATLPSRPSGRVDDETFMQRCSPEAVKTTTNLGLPTDHFYEVILDFQHERRNETPVFVREGTVRARWLDQVGFDKLFPPGLEEKLHGAVLLGRARVDGERLSVQLDTLLLKNGDRSPVCAVAYEWGLQESGPGLWRYPPPHIPEPDAEEMATLKDLRPGEFATATKLHFVRLR